MLEMFHRGCRETGIVNWYWTLDHLLKSSTAVFLCRLHFFSPVLQDMLSWRHCSPDYDLISLSHLKILEFTFWLRCLLDTLAHRGVATLNSDCNSVTCYWSLRLSVYVRWDRIWQLVVSYWLSDLRCWEAHWMVRRAAARQFGSSVNSLWLSLWLCSISISVLSLRSHALRNALGC